MKSATMTINNDLFVGEKRHEATFVVLNLEDGSTAPMGQIYRVPVRDEYDALQWAADHSIRVVPKTS